MAEENKEIRERNIREFFAVLNEANVFTISCPRCGDMRFSFGFSVSVYRMKNLKIEFSSYESRI